MKIKLGIERLDDFKEVFEGKKVGLITNPTGIDSNFKSSIDILNEKTILKALYAPEHGIRGSVQAGLKVATYIDEETGIPVYSLYGETRKPTEEMLKDIDLLAIDIQDVGSRFYTYIYTMAYSMMACKEHNKTFVVFDRPNPINGVDFEGNILDLTYRSFVGYYPIVQRHGMTIGELAKMFNEEFGIGCDLVIIPMENWKREMSFEDTGLPWVYPSPNLPTINSTYAYNATCVFEGTNVSEGRGTTLPFELVGAPWIKPETLAKALNDLGLPGVHFRVQYFMPTFSKHKDEMCGGVQVHILDRKKFLPVRTGWAMLEVIRDLYPNDFEVNKPYVEGRPRMLQYNTGCNYILEREYSLAEQFAIIDRDSKQFTTTRSKYLLY